MAMTTMVERMARAIAANHSVDPDMLGPGQRHVADIDGITTIVSDHRGPLWKMWVPDALSALKAMKNPPPSIKARGAKALFNNQDLAHDAWVQMIDEAIREAEQ